MQSVGTVTELRRYPVKSLAGEVLSTAEVDERGVLGDRLWAVTDPDGKLGSGKSSRRFRKMPGLLELAASYGEQSVPVIAFPDGRRVTARDPRVHEILSGYVGRPVRLRAEGSVSHFDSRPLHLVTTASLATLARAHGTAVATERFRPNLLVEVPEADGFAEDEWVDRKLAIGPTLVVRVHKRTPRCVMVDLPQIDMPSAAGLLDTIGQVNEANLGVLAEIVSPGVVSVGDAVELLT